MFKSLIMQYWSYFPFFVPMFQVYDSYDQEYPILYMILIDTTDIRDTRRKILGGSSHES